MKRFCSWSKRKIAGEGIYVQYRKISYSKICMGRKMREGVG